MRIPLDPSIEMLSDVPHTISFVIRKRQQIDGLNELPKDKRPPEEIIWDGTPEEMDEWLDTVFDRNKQQSVDLLVSEIEE